MLSCLGQGLPDGGLMLRTWVGWRVCLPALLSVSEIGCLYRGR
jgi:hypothetical protein